MTITKTMIAAGILCIAMYNAGTAGTKRWAVVAYWTAVTLYWLLGVIG